MVPSQPPNGFPVSDLVSEPANAPDSGSRRAGPRTRAEAVYADLREDILSGALKPGAKLEDGGPKMGLRPGDGLRPVVTTAIMVELVV